MIKEVVHDHLFRSTVLTLAFYLQYFCDAIELPTAPATRAGERTAGAVVNEEVLGVRRVKVVYSATETMLYKKSEEEH
jgi:hypothetical protein